MLPKQYSFKLRRQRGFFDKAQRVFSRYFTLFYVPAQTFGVVVVIPKKVVKLATGRNKLKRKIESYILEIMPDIDVSSPGFFVCLVAKSATVTASKAELMSELAKKFGSLTKNED